MTEPTHPMYAASERTHQLLQQLVADGEIAEEATGGLLLRWACYMDIRLPDGGDYYALMPSPDTTRKDNLDVVFRGAMTELVDWIADAVVEQLREAGDD